MSKIHQKGLLESLLSKPTMFAMVLACAAPITAFAQMGGTGSSGSGSMMGGSSHSTSSKPMMGHAGKTAGSPWVKSIQAALNRKEHAHLAVDGKMGHATEIALKKFQKTHGLKPTGHPNKATDHALGI